MLRYLLRRIVYAVPILVGVSLVTFIVFYATVSPATMARQVLGPKATTQQIKEWVVQRGYDRPRSEQFSKHMRELLLLKFGKSDTTEQDIWTNIRQRAPISAAIGGIMFVGGVVTAICFSLAVAYFRGTYIDYWGTFICVLLMSVVYVVYVIAGQYLLGKVLRYFPLAGFQPGLGMWKFTLLPAVIGIISGLGASVRFYRTLLLEEMGQDYVRTARAKGVSEKRVLFRHVLKNASISILTSTVLAIPFLITGSLVLESFFAIPGLGTLTVDAINASDFATVRAMVFLGAILYIIGAILTDVSYTLVDPRLRLE